MHTRHPGGSSRQGIMAAAEQDRIQTALHALNKLVREIGGGHKIDVIRKYSRKIDFGSVQPKLYP